MNAVIDQRRLLAAAIATFFIVGMGSATATAQEIFEEDFDTATGSGGGEFFDGAGAGEIIDWDTGVEGETAFIGTTGNANITAAAQGNPAGGVSGGAGEFNTSNLRFDMLEQDFDGVSGMGGGVFLTGDGLTPDLAGGTNSWDSEIGNEGAFFSAIDGGILVGSVSASGDPTGDQSGGGAGVLDVGEVDVTIGNWFAGLTFDINGFPPGSGAILLNPGFDGDANICDGLDGWNFQGDGGYCLNVYLAATGQTGQAEPRSAPQDLKMFNFGGQPTNSEVYQDIAAIPGQVWRLDCFTAHVSGDALAAGNRTEMSIEFYDDNETMLDEITAVTLEPGSPVSDPSPTPANWIDNDPIELTAPAGTTTARAVIRFVAEAGAGGAAFIDDVSFTVVGGSFDYGQFSLTADIKGETSVSGGILGHYQLRLEDNEGDRLVFPSQAVADGNWAELGGPLDMAEERDSDDTPMEGVFDPGSSFLTVVVAFDNAVAPTWGAGGTLYVDDLLMTNTNPSGSEYAGGLFWDDILPTAERDPRKLRLAADIKGSVPGGTYQLRVEAFQDGPECVNEDFSTVTGEGGGQILFPEGAGANTDDWDTGITNEFGFAGIADGAVVTDPAGEVSISGVPGGGMGGLGGGEIVVHEIAPLAGSWFAGVFWENQTLGSTDLTAVSLTANIRGTNPGFFEELGTYILRIEDGPSGDWIGWETLANGAWQAVGGPLSSATDGGAGDAGDGIFDVELNRAYRVVIVYVGFDNLDGTNWNFGGTLEFDDIVLSPCGDPLQFELARLGFNGEADGGFQSVGGALSSGFTSLPPSGGTFEPGTDADGVDIDAGIEGEFMFAGLFGGDIGSITAEGCSSCGVGGSGGIRYVADDLDDSGAGFYFLGAGWTITTLTTPLDIADVAITADIKGEWNAGTGGTPGTIVFRLEEAGNADGTDKDRIFYSMQADGSFNSMGGLLDCSDPPAGQTCGFDDDDPADGIFDPNSPLYRLVLLIFTQDPSWGTNASITMDNLTITQGGDTVFSEDFETVVGPGPGLIPEETDSYTVTVTLEGGVEMWGDGGTLTVDNLILEEGCAPDGCFYCPLDGSPGFAKTTQADIGGSNGACDPDGACDGNDRFSALNCFANQSTLGASPFPCELDAPTAANTDAGKGFDGTVGGTCARDGICDGNDAFHALNCFENDWFDGSTPYRCGCTGPQPQAPAEDSIVTREVGTGVTLRAPAGVRAGELLDVDVHFEDGLEALRGYQLHLGVSGGQRGGFELVDIDSNFERKDHVFASVPGVWTAFNLDNHQMVVGMDASEGVPAKAGSYLATFTYRVPRDAAGTFVIDLRYDDSAANPQERTFLFGAHAAPIGVEAVTPARVTVHSGRAGHKGGIVRGR